MKSAVALGTYLTCLIMISLLVAGGCAAPPKQPLTTVGPRCSISWDKPNDPKVTGYQLTVIELNGSQKNTLRFILADTTKISCKDAGADHEGLWDVALQSCYNKTTCGPSTKLTPIRITAE